jgi:hypothetical protein
VAHLPGFLVSWRLMTTPDLPYKTALLWGRVDLGADGIKVIGVLWLLVAVALVSSAAGLCLDSRWSFRMVLPLLVMSALLCALDLPAARLGLFANVVLLALLVAHPSQGVGVRRWNADTADLATAIRMDAVGGPVTSAATPAGDVPAIVSRYFSRSLLHDNAPPTTVVLTQRGEFRMSDSSDSWKPFEATETFSLQAPAFVWDARIRMLPGVPVLVRDSYRARRGGMSASVLGLFTVMDAEPTTQLAEGALQRYLGEAVWFPAALLPSRGVEWTAVNATTARATIRHAEHLVSLDFQFSSEGDVVRVFTAARAREVDGRFVPTPWEITCSNHQTRGDVRIPLSCEVAWRFSDGLSPYWRGEVLSYSVMGDRLP